MSETITVKGGERTGADFRNLLDGIEEACFEVDLRGNFIFANRAAREMAGLGKEELTGKNSLQYAPPETAKRLSEVFRKIYETGQPAEIRDYDFIGSGGGKRVLELSASLVLDEGGKPAGFRGIGRDVTERNRVKEVWRQYEFIANASRDLMTMINRDYVYEAVNEAYARAHRMKREDVAGKTVAEMWGEGSFNETIRAFIDRCMGGEEVNYQAWFRFPALGMRYFNVNYYPYRNERDEVTHTVVISHDMTEHQKAKEALKVSLEELGRTLEETVASLSSALEARDPYTAGHQRRVAKLACAIAGEMGMEETKIHAVRLAALVHDVGKINVPTEILTKPGRLTSIEMSMIKLHSEVGFEILRHIPFPWPIARMVLEHHEKMNGSGYPGGLQEGDILPESEVIAVADVVEAMSSHRPYRPTLGIGAALGEIEKNRGILYSRPAADACLRLFREKGFSFEQNE
jgi:PAS domain S-box-containing protein/putative nucleotidyltransferase with HDIG domain